MRGRDGREEGGREEGRDGPREGWKKGGREGGMDQERDGWREGVRDGQRGDGLKEREGEECPLGCRPQSTRQISLSRPVQVHVGLKTEFSSSLILHR